MFVFLKNCCKNFCTSVCKGCGFAVGVLLFISLLWLGYSFLFSDLVHVNINFFADKYNTVFCGMNSTAKPLSADAIYSATISYYNQIISVLIFIAGIAGVIAFAHIGIISKEKAEEISEASAERGVKHHFEKQEFHEQINRKIVDTFESDFGLSTEILEDIKNRIDELEYKYDRHDDLLHAERERELADQELSIPSNTGEE